VSEVKTAHVLVDPRTGSPRDVCLDALRGFAILLVVLGHALLRGLDVLPVGAPGAVDITGIGTVAMGPATSTALTVIYSFHMPLLAFVSGFALSHSSVGYGAAFVRRRAAGLLVPYFAWLAVSWPIVGERTVGGLVAYVGRAAINPQSPGALWFLYALFVCTVLLAAMLSLRAGSFALAGSALVVGIAGVLPLGAYEHVFGLSDVAWLYPFLIAGFITARNRAAVDGVRWAGPLALLVWLASLPFVAPVLLPGPRWWYAGARTLLAALPTPLVDVLLKATWAGVRLIGALAGVYAAYYAFRHLHGAVATAQAWLGRRTLGVYAVHIPLLMLLAPVLAGLHVGLRALVLFAGALTVSLAITLLLERTRLTRRVLLGMRR